MAIAIGQHTGSATSSTSLTTSSITTQPLGSVFIAIIQIAGSSLGFPLTGFTISDTFGNAYGSNGGQTFTNFGGLFLNAIASTPGTAYGGAGHQLTVNYGGPGTVNNLNVWLVEILGLRTGGSYDFSSGANAEQTGPYPGPSIVTSTNHQEICIVSAGNNTASSFTYSETTTFTLVDQLTASYPGCWGYKLVTTSGTYQPTFTVSSGTPILFMAGAAYIQSSPIIYSPQLVFQMP